MEDNLDASRQKALAALLARDTVAAAAGEAGLSEATLYRYLKEAGFKSALRAARRQAVEHAVAQLQGRCAAAVKTLT